MNKNIKIELYIEGSEEENKRKIYIKFKRSYFIFTSAARTIGLLNNLLNL
jgi:hypothetical protein